MKRFLIAISLLALSACTAPEDATRVLQENGYTNINILGHAFFMCSDDDYFSTEFTAKNSNGVVVHGAVCSGLTKGATIRFY